MSYDDEPIERLPDVRERKQRGSALGRVITRLFGLGLLSAAVIGGAGAYLYVTFTAAGPLADAKIVNLPATLGPSDLAYELEQQGVISNAAIFSAALKVNEWRGRPAKLGEYSFSKSASMADVLQALAAGRVITYKFTIPEGFTSQMAVDRLNNLEGLSAKVTTLPPEGTLLANTVLFTRGTDPNQLIAKIAQQQTKLVDELWAQKPADSPLKTKEEMVILASIVEKETGQADERPLVASVFLNRLKAGMRLQSDPTIIYGIVGGKGKLDRAITRADIEQTTPYNTYRINGLPPGPIANPGKASLEAVVKPATTTYLYFVADGTGGHAFATTLDEHNANVQKWRAQQNPPADAAVEPAVTDAKPDDVKPADAPVPGEIDVPKPEVKTPGLPEVDATPPVAATEDPAASAAEDLKQTTDVPAPVVEEKPAVVAEAEKPIATENTRDLKPTEEKKPDEVKPEEPKPEEAKPETETLVEAQPVVLKPGKIMEIKGKLIPIPALKKKKP